ncbi:MAG TPA: hypothetical protein VMJ66_06975 [Geobacteraceae bacterium]|nr:hypothetical protein [Geobacteraceae bacterium]
MKRKVLTSAFWATISLAAALLFSQLPGCGGGGGNGFVVGGGSGSSSVSNGSLQVGITDSPAFPIS